MYIDTCTNTDNGLKDKGGFGCDVYTDDVEGWCGKYDNGLFEARKKCCVCGGGRHNGKYKFLYYRYFIL